MTREATEMEVRVAKILEPALESKVDGVALYYAQLVIRAMREPTREMKKALNLKLHPSWLAEMGYIAMIDAASPPEGK